MRDRGFCRSREHWAKARFGFGNQLIIIKCDGKEHLC